MEMYIRWNAPSSFAGVFSGVLGAAHRGTNSKMIYTGATFTNYLEKVLFLWLQDKSWDGKDVE